jgi:hypothetical protein
MNQPPKTTFEYCIRFVCAALVSGLLVFVLLLRFANELSVSTLVVVWAIATFAASAIAAQVGDSAWEYLLKTFWLDP